MRSMRPRWDDGTGEETGRDMQQSENCRQAKDFPNVSMTRHQDSRSTHFVPHLSDQVDLELKDLCRNRKAEIDDTSKRQRHAPSMTRDLAN